MEPPVVGPFLLVVDVKTAIAKTAAADAQIASPSMELPRHGTCAIYIQGRIESGLWAAWPTSADRAAAHFHPMSCPRVPGPVASLAAFGSNTRHMGAEEIVNAFPDEKDPGTRRRVGVRDPDGMRGRKQRQLRTVDSQHMGSGSLG